MNIKASFPSVFAALLTASFSLLPSLRGQSSVYNIYDSLARTDTTYSSFTYNPNGAIIQDTDGEHHIQGIGYHGGYYYIVQSRPDTANTQKLLIVNENTATVVNKLTLDTASTHPGGFQIHNGIMAVPFEITGGNAKINFYNLSSPTAPALAGSFATSVGNGYCVGLTDYNGDYLVAHYYSRPGKLRFYRFNSSFAKVAEQSWDAAVQDRSHWSPYSDWRNDTDFNYESMSLMKVVPSGSTTASYFMIMYHNTDSADVFSISDPSLSGALDIQMVYSLNFTPYGPGFRYGTGVAITDQNNLLFFSSLKHVHAATSANVISVYESRPNWPWKLPSHYASGGDQDVAINESGLVVELHRGSIGGANATKIYSRVGVTNTTTETVAWGSGIDTGLTGENVSIALNSSGYCVALHRGTGANSAQHYYRVGQVNASTKTITWGTTTNYDTGGDLAVAMDDSNHVVEVHRGNPSGGSPNNHYYRVGALNPTAKTISWLTGGTLYATGGALSLAVDNSGHCLEVHRGSPGGSNAANHYYQLGTINYTTGVITWGSGTNYDTGGDLDIALTSAGACLEVHRGDPAGSNADNHYYKIGTVNWSAGTVSWSSGALFETGGAVAVAIDNNKNGLNVHRGRDGGSNESEHYAALIKVP